jgi:2-phospho-L-lactate/phosphoenolpyruvate guanylyltransferase
MLPAMRVLAIPVKSLERAKTRLASVLSPAERAALSLVMLEDVLDACLAQRGWEVWVVSRDEAALEIGVRRGARPLLEKGTSLLGAVRQTESEVVGRGGHLAVVLADLPFLTPEALAVPLELGDASGRRAGVVAAPAASDGGTNLLLRRPPSVIRARFGRSSFAKHRWAARRARVPFEEVRRLELAFDLDRPEDLARVLTGRDAGRTRSACLEMGIPERLRVYASSP